MKYYDSKYLLNTEEFFKRNPDITDDIKKLIEKDIEAADFEMFSFIMTYIFM